MFRFVLRSVKLPLMTSMVLTSAYVTTYKYQTSFPQFNGNSFISYNDGAVEGEGTVKANEEDRELTEEEWEIEKSKCSFCRQFIESPCKEVFKKWSKCVDRCKEEENDFVAICSEQTKGLMQCVEVNSEFFAAKAAEIEKKAAEEETPEPSTESLAEGESKEEQELVRVDVLISADEVHSQAEAEAEEGERANQ